MLSLIKSRRSSSKEGKSGGGGGSGGSASRFLGSLTKGVSREQPSVDRVSMNNISVRAGALSNSSAAATQEALDMRPPSRTDLVDARPGDRPPSRGADRPPSRGMDRPPSRNRQPRLGVSSSSPSPYLFEDDPGIMSEIETSSTRFRQLSKEKTGHILPRTSPNQAPRGYSIVTGPAQVHHRQPKDALPPPPSSSSSSGMYDDDPGIMSEAETASTTRSKRRSRNNIPMGSLSLNRQGGPLHGGKYGHIVSSTLYEEDSGIMSEAETSSTSSKSRRHQKYLLPVVRTPSKTLERPLGMVFLIYRGETKRALLPNEITSVITVKALFVRSFNKILTMDYMDLPRVKIYIHDSAKDIFYDLENLAEIRDRTILKVFEADSSGRGPGGLGPSGLPPITNSDEVPAEPEYVDSRAVKANKILSRAQKEQQENGLGSRPASAASSVSSTLPRNAFSSLDQKSAVGDSLRLTSSATASESRSKTLGSNFLRGQRLTNSLGNGKSGLGSRVESGYISSPDGNGDFDSNSAASASASTTRSIMPRFSSQPQGRYYPGPANTEEAKARMMHMEAQLSQLTGMVEKALKNKKLGKKQVSFDKSVTFNDEQPASILTTSKRHHSHQLQQQQQIQQQQSHVHHHHPVVAHASTAPNPELNGQLKRLHRSTRELKQEVRVLKRLTQLQSMAMKDLVQDTYLKLREACISFSSQNGLLSSADHLEHWRIAQDEELFSRELAELLQTILELEGTVEEVRSGVINKKNKIMLQDVEGMAQTLSHCSKTVTQLRQAFPTLEANLKASEGITKRDTGLMTEFLKRSSERLENAWRRCKKLTGTLVTLRRLASVQEQRFHPGSAVIDLSLSPTPSELLPKNKESTLDDLLDALQTYTIQPSSTSSGLKKDANSPQLVSKPQTTVQTAKVKPQTHLSTEDVDSGSPLKRPSSPPKPTPPCPPPRTTPLTSKAAPPPPPPRTSSTHKTSVPNEDSPPPPPSTEPQSANNPLIRKLSNGAPPAVAPKPDVTARAIKSQTPDLLESRHLELLTRQKQLQEQYQRLQEMQKRNNNNNGSATTTAVVTVAAKQEEEEVVKVGSSEVA